MSRVLPCVAWRDPRLEADVARLGALLERSRATILASSAQLARIDTGLTRTSTTLSPAHTCDAETALTRMH
jgi:hypothetical protein